MAKIKINGDSSGYVELTAPNAAHNNTLELGPGTKILTDKNTHTGNIGIGTDNPQAKLQVNGTITQIGKSGAAASTAIDPLASFVLNDEEARLQLCSTNTGNNASGIILSNESKHFVLHQKGADLSNRFDIGYLDDASPTDINNQSTPRLTITTGGKIGVNETAPAADLVVKQSGNTFTTQSQTVALFQRSSTNGHGAKIAIVAGTGGSSDINFGDTADEDIGIIQYFHTDNSFRFTTNTAEALRIDSSGNVNFGANKAVALPSGTGIQVYNSSAPRIKLVNDTTGNAAGDGLQIYVSGSSAIFDQKENAEMRFYTNATEKLRIDSSGCLRVGNTHSQTTSGNTKRIALGAKASIWGWTSGNINGALTLADNYYWDGGNNRAIEADEAAYLTLRSGTLRYGTTDSTPSAGGVTGLTEKFRVDTSGNLLLGQGHTTASDLAGGFTKRLSIEGTSALNSSIGLTRNANDDNPPYIYFGKSRGTSAGSNTVIGNGDTIGMINFAGSRGSGSFGDAVNLRAHADANFGGSSSPGRFSVWTTPVNSSSPLESFQVNSAGAITAPRNVAWSYSRSNNGASWGANSGATYPNLSYRTPIPLFGTSATNYDTHNALSTFTVGSGTGIKFTAPVGGKYLVMLNMSSVKNEVDSDWGSIGLMRNTTSSFSSGSLDYMLDTMYFPNSTSTLNQLGWGGSVIVNLSQNDYIVPYSMSVDKFSSDNQYYFQGYLLG